MKQKMKGFFLQLGKSFLLPIALISAAGIFLGISSAFSNPNIVSDIPFLANNFIQGILGFTKAITGVLFGNLAIFFAISISVGLAKEEKAVSAFSGFVGYLVLHTSVNYMLECRGILAEPDMMREMGQAVTLGIQTLELGVFGGIVVGIITASLHNKYYNIKLPDYLGFFGGTRFVPIITTVVFSILGIIIPYIWPYVNTIIQSVGIGIASLGYLGTFAFGFLERLLIPFGLHHILNAMFRFTEVGGSLVVGGQEVFGALNIFLAQLSDPETISFSTEATRFLAQGKIPIMVFGLPAAAYAMYKTAKPENRSKVKGILLAGALATFVTGITEPLEFSFLFISPILFVIHAFLSGISFMMMHIFGVAIGNTQGGIIDLVVFGVMQPNTKWIYSIMLGLVYTLVYYNVFKILILKFNLQTPGREEIADINFDLEPLSNKVEIAQSGETTNRALSIIKYLGGKDNIEDITNCITRLRVVVKDMSKVDENAFKKYTGAMGVIKVSDKDIQIIYGPSVSQVRDEVSFAMSI